MWLKNEILSLERELQEVEDQLGLNRPSESIKLRNDALAIPDGDEELIMTGSKVRERIDNAWTRTDRDIQPGYRLNFEANWEVDNWGRKSLVLKDTDSGQTLSVGDGDALMDRIRNETDTDKVRLMITDEMARDWNCQ